MTGNPKEKFNQLLGEVDSLLSEGRDAEAVPSICYAFWLTFKTELEDGDWGDEQFALNFLLAQHHERRQG
jgi:hypothetical protein